MLKLAQCRNYTASIPAKFSRLSNTLRLGVQTRVPGQQLQGGGRISKKSKDRHIPATVCTITTRCDRMMHIAPLNRTGS